MIQGIDAIVGQIDIFKDLRPEDAELLAGCASLVRFDAGELIHREGDPADRFYIVRHGHVALEMHVPGSGTVTVETLQPGDVLGWSWLVPPFRCYSDARALDLVRAVSFDGSCIRRKCETDPRVGYEMMRRFAQVMAERLQGHRLRLLDLYAKPARS